MKEVNKFKIYIGIFVSILFIVIVTLFVLYLKNNFIDSNNEEENKNVIDNTSIEEITNINNVSFIKKIEDYSLYCDKTKDNYSLCFIKYNDSKYNANLIYEKKNEFIFEFEIDSKKYLFNSFDNSISNNYIIEDIIKKYKK